MYNIRVSSLYLMSHIRMSKYNEDKLESICKDVLMWNTPRGTKF